MHYPKIDQLLGVDLFFMPHLNFIALSGNCKSVLTIHDLSFLRYPEFFSLRKNFWHQMINVKSLVKKFDQLVAVSENTKRDIIELGGVNPDKIKVIYSAVGEQIKDLKDDNSKLAEIKRKYQLPDKFILHLGTIEPRKNIANLIYAYELLQKKSVQFANYELIIVGVNGWKSKEIFKVRQKSNFKNKIKFIGYVDSINKVYLYRLASVFVYPSFYEGFGFPPLEAMTLGVPVITSFNSSLPEVTAGAALMIDPENISQIAKCLEEVLTDQELREELIKKGLARARQFDWEKSAKEYLKIFYQLAYK